MPKEVAAILILKIHGDKIMEGKIIGNHFPANEYDFTPHDFVARSWPVTRVTKFGSMAESAGNLKFQGRVSEEDNGDVSRG